MVNDFWTLSELTEGWGEGPSDLGYEPEKTRDIFCCLVDCEAQKQPGSMQEHHSLVEKRSADWKNLSCSNVGVEPNVSNRSFPVVPTRGHNFSKFSWFPNVPFGGALDMGNPAELRYFVVNIVLFVGYKGAVVAPHHVVYVVSEEASSFNLLVADVRKTLEETYF